MRDQGEKTVKSSLGQGPVSPSPEYTQQCLPAVFADTESHSGWEKLTINLGMLPTSLQTPDGLDLKADDVDSYLPHHPPLRRTLS